MPFQTNTEVHETVDKPGTPQQASAHARSSRRRWSVALINVRAQNDILHHNVRLALDRLLEERLHLDAEIADEIAEVNKLSPRRHYSIGAAWVLWSRTRGETFSYPAGPRFQLNRILRNGDRYTSYLRGITLALCKRCFLRAYYSRLKRFERRIRALSERRREVNEQLNVARRALSYARRYAIRRRALVNDLGLGVWLQTPLQTTNDATKKPGGNDRLSLYLQRLDGVRSYIKALHQAIVDDLRYLYRRRMSLERSMDRLAAIVYRRRMKRHSIVLAWDAKIARAGRTFMNPRGPQFAILLNDENGKKLIRVKHVSRAACKQTNQLKDYPFLKRVDKELRRYRDEYDDINRRLDTVRRRLHVVPRKPYTRQSKGAAA